MNQSSGHSTPTGTRSPINGFTLGVAVVLAIGAMLIFTLSSGSGDDEGVTGFTETAPVVVTGNALPPFDNSNPDPAVGMPLPLLDGVDFNGSPSRIEASGTPQALLFVAHWCPHCQNEVPRVRALRASATWTDDVELTTIATSTYSDRPNYPPSDWLAREGLTVLSDTVMVDSSSNDALRAFGGSGFPFWVFVDGNGNVVQRASGELGDDAIMAAVNALVP